MEETNCEHKWKAGTIRFADNIALVVKSEDDMNLLINTLSSSLDIF